MQQARRRGKRRRFKPLRRLLLIATIFLLMYGTFSLGKWTYNVALAPRIKYTTVQVVDQPLYQGKAVVVRDELVIAAPKNGVLNILIDGQSKVKSGQPIFELVDQSLLVSIDKQLAEEAAKILGKTSQTDDAVQFKKDQLSSALTKIRQLSLRYTSLLNQKKGDEATRAFRDLESASKAADKLQQEYDLITRSQTQYEDKRQELLGQRALAVTSVAAPLNGIVSYRTDGMENRLKAADVTDATLTMLRQVKGVQATAANGIKMSAGQAVATIIESGHLTLMLETKTLGSTSGAVEVVFADEVLNAEITAYTSTSEEDTYIVTLRVTQPPVSMLEERLVEISLRAKGEVLVAIPKSAMWENEAKTYVYVPSSEGVHTFKEVFLRQTLSKSVIVAGLDVGETVVTNPKLVAQKGTSQ